MRKAAGVIMIIICAILLGLNVVLLSLHDGRIGLFNIFVFAGAILAFIGGILCLMRRCWGVCLASAIAAVFFGLFGLPLVLFGWIVGFPLVLVGGIVSTVFISLRKKEWQEIAA